MWVGTDTFLSLQSFSQLIAVNLEYDGIKERSKVLTSTGWKLFAFGVGMFHISLHSERNWDLHCKPPYSVQMQKKTRTRKKPRTCSGFVVHKLKFVFVSILRMSSFLWFRRSLHWCSMVKNLSFKHK